MRFIAAAVFFVLIQFSAQVAFATAPEENDAEVSVDTEPVYERAIISSALSKSAEEKSRIEAEFIRRGPASASTENKSRFIFVDGDDL